MKILTKKKQKEILDLLVEIGIFLVNDSINIKTYDYINQRCYGLTSEIGGLDAVQNYYDSVDRAIMRKMGGK